MFQLNRNQNRRRQQIHDPPLTRTDISMSRQEATTRKARQVSFDAIAPEEANTTEADTINLVPGPPSQTNQKIEDTKKLDFT